MSVLHHLNAVAALRYANLEGTLIIGGNGLSVGVHHLNSVAQEANSRYWDTAAFVEHVAREEVVVGLREDNVGLQIDIFVEADELWVERSHTGGVTDGERVLAELLIYEASDFEVTRAVGLAAQHLGILDVSNGLCRNGVAGQTDAVGQTHVAAHHTCRTAASLFLSTTDVVALTLGHALNDIDVVVLRTHVAVDVCHL